MRTASVALDIPTRAIEKLFDYAVPDGMTVEVGCSVLLEFGHRKCLGYVVEIDDDFDEASVDFKLSPIEKVLSESFFDAASAKVAQWISTEYVCPFIDAIKLFVLTGATHKLRKDSDGLWQMDNPKASELSDKWVSIVEDNSSGVAENEEKGGFIPRKNATKQIALLELLKRGEMSVADIALSLPNASTTIKELAEKGVIQIDERRKLRKLHGDIELEEPVANLTKGQHEALETIKEQLQSACIDGAKHSPILIDGITGSGKTEVYLQAIAEVLHSGGSACVLVPEISLTPQTVSRFRKRFSDQVAVLHSRLSIGERLDQWYLLQSGKAKVAVGARSALFAPYKNLKLIIIDEEHEYSYKSSSSPRYSTRDVATKIAELRGTVLVLGSASPSLETLNRVKLGQYEQVVLSERPTSFQLPKVEVVDLTKEFKTNKTMVSGKLRDALIATAGRKEKAVILLNRRGYASYLLCRECGYVPTCKNCSTSYTYHEGSGTRANYLLCHHCDSRIELPTVCPECGSVYLKQVGHGTQFAYDQIKAILPEEVDIVRMDADTTKGKGSHEDLLNRFGSSGASVLLGTQMIAKGLDFADVTLVGVLIADTALNIPDFRASERTYQLLEQVSGRAGRADKEGNVIVQTYKPAHPAIRAAANHSRQTFLDYELPIRKELFLPPYSRLANIVFWGADYKAVADSSKSMSEILRTRLASDEFQILGSSPCMFSKLKGKFRWHILVKSDLNFDLPQTLTETVKGFKVLPEVSMSVDIDPLDLL